MKRFSFFAALFLLVVSAKAQYTVTNFISGLKYPVTFQIADDGRYYVCQKGGDGFSADVDAQVRIFSSTGTALGVLWDFTDSVETYFERGVLGVAIDPEYSTNNYVYVFYNHKTPAKIRVVRFTEVANVGTNPTVIFEYNDPFSAGNHTGGNIHFKPGDNNHLYISIGDRATQANAQLLTNPCGKMLRINKDGSIPTDNPFYDDGNVATGNDDRIWAYGLRNSFDFTFSPINDSLYASENGLNTWDEVNQIHRSANYGWPTCEGFFNQGSTSTPCSNSNSILPIDDWGTPLPAVTGILIYDHPLMPEFQGHMLVVDYDYGDIHDFTLTGTGLNQVAARTTVPVTLGTLDQLTDINQGQEGCIYVIHGGYTSNGVIRKICPSNMGLSEEEAQIAFEVVPNPTEGLVKLTFVRAQLGATVNVLDISGRLLLSQNVNGLTLDLDLSSFSSGTYLVQLQDEKGSSVKRVVVE